VNLGDENTSYFQALATYNFNRNLISALVASDDTIITKHDQKAGILLEAFKSRLGVRVF